MAKNLVLGLLWVFFLLVFLANPVLAGEEKMQKGQEIPLSGRLFTFPTDEVPDSHIYTIHLQKGPRPGLWGPIWSDTDIYGQTWLRWFNIEAIAIVRTVLYAGTEEEVSKALRLHEDTHREQWRRDGPITFMLRYFGEYFWYRIVHGLSHNQAYRNISYEEEARQAEKKIVQ